MANVDPSDHEPPTRRDRAQLLIVIGIVLAIMLVSLALFLNNIIYVENVGSRGADIGGSDATEFVTTPEEDSETLLRAANEEETDFDDQSESLATDLAEWNDQSRLHYMSRGVYTSVELDGDPAAGTQIAQDEDRNFTDRQGNPLWRLASDVEARDFVLNVSEDNLSDETDAFRLSVTEGTLSDGQNLSIYEDGGNITVADESGTECETGDDRAVVNFASGTLNGEECEITIFEGLDTYSIWYVNGDEIEGQYRLVVNANTDDLDPGTNDLDPELSLSLHDTYHSNPNDGSPYAIDAIWSADVAVTYENSRVEYNSVIEIVPGEIHD